MKYRPPDLIPFDIRTALTLTAAAHLVRGQARDRVCRDVLSRWVGRGYAPRGWTGPRLEFPTELIGAVRYTMPQWVRAFEAERLKMSERLRAPKQDTPRQAQRAHERAVKELEAQGFTVG